MHFKAIAMIPANLLPDDPDENDAMDLLYSELEAFREESDSFSVPCCDQTQSFFETLRDEGVGDIIGALANIRDYESVDEYGHVMISCNPNGTYDYFSPFNDGVLAKLDSEEASYLYDPSFKPWAVIDIEHADWADQLSREDYEWALCRYDGKRGEYYAYPLDCHD
jgi:hypothetical protein